MALAVVGEAAVGAVVGELLRVVLETVDKPTIFRSTFERLRLTLESISPLIEQIEYQNYALGPPKREIERLIRGLEDGKKLICKCSNVRRWNYVKQMRYQKRLVASDESLARFLKVEMQALMARDQRETLLAVRQISMVFPHAPNHDVYVEVYLAVGVPQFGGGKFMWAQGKFIPRHPVCGVPPEMVSRPMITGVETVVFCEKNDPETVFAALDRNMAHILLNRCRGGAKSAVHMRKDNEA